MNFRDAQLLNALQEQAQIAFQIARDRGAYGPDYTLFDWVDDLVQEVCEVIDEEDDAAKRQIEMTDVLIILLSGSVWMQFDIGQTLLQKQRQNREKANGGGSVSLIHSARRKAEAAATDESRTALLSVASRDCGCCTCSTRADGAASDCFPRPAAAASD